MRIGEVAARVGVNPKTIRFYEQVGLLPRPTRRPSGYREYGERDVSRLTFIRTAQRLGLTLADIREILAFRERGEAPCSYVLTVLARQAAELDQRINELVQLRDELTALCEQAVDLPQDDGCYCGVIEHAQILGPPAHSTTRPGAGEKAGGRARTRRP